MDKAVILAGGKGVRFGTLSESIPKPMAVVRGRPIIHYIVTMLKRMGLKELFIVVGYRREVLMDYFHEGKDIGLKIEYVDNANIGDKKRSGLSDAVLLMKDLIEEPFLTILGDEIYVGTKHASMMRNFESCVDCEAMIAVHRTPNLQEVKKNYAVRIDAGSNVLDLEEKPANPWNDLIGCGTYIFRPSVFGCIERTEVSSRTGRKELADTLKCMIDEEKRVKAFEIGGKYLNINFAEDMRTAEKLIEEAETVGIEEA